MTFDKLLRIVQRLLAALFALFPPIVGLLAATVAIGRSNRRLAASV
jgi:hypothetical protein